MTIMYSLVTESRLNFFTFVETPGMEKPNALVLRHTSKRAMKMLFMIAVLEFEKIISIKDNKTPVNLFQLIIQYKRTLELIFLSHKYKISCSASTIDRIKNLVLTFRHKEAINLRRRSY